MMDVVRIGLGLIESGGLDLFFEASQCMKLWLQIIIFHCLIGDVTDVGEGLEHGSS